MTSWVDKANELGAARRVRKTPGVASNIALTLSLIVGLAVAAMLPTESPAHQLIDPCGEFVDGDVVYYNNCASGHATKILVGSVSLQQNWEECVPAKTTKWISVASNGVSTSPVGTC